ncbi:hypothetical protein [Microbacterium sp. YJN-G]|uniref:hypothetical protein n=1 Tax=Microbacterium sp. YJN-G TaxID=2763257 RepID=UPI0018788F75|nr:hypothetical protein [Microbacterium sp. YJN-G]
MVGIGVSVVLALIALRVSWSANRLTASANALAAQAIELTRRAERRRFGEAVQGYYDSRRKDIWSGKNWNMPHYTHDVLGVANEVQEPNTDVLLKWLTDTIDRILDADSYPTQDIDHWHSSDSRTPFG